MIYLHPRTQSQNLFSTYIIQNRLRHIQKYSGWEIDPFLPN